MVNKDKIENKKLDKTIVSDKQKKETDNKPISLKERWNLDDCKVTDLCSFR